MPRCVTPGCGSYAINHDAHGRDGSDGDLCDVCYWRKRARGLPRWALVRDALAGAVQPTTTITPLEEQQMFDDWCPYKGNPDTRTVWAAAIDAVNGMLLAAAPKAAQPTDAAWGQMSDEERGVVWRRLKQQNQGVKS